jgi:hypothetical protein
LGLCCLLDKVSLHLIFHKVLQLMNHGFRILPKRT